MATEEGQDQEGSLWAGCLLPGELQVSGERWFLSGRGHVPEMYSTGTTFPSRGLFLPWSSIVSPSFSPLSEQRLLLGLLVELILAAPGTCSLSPGQGDGRGESHDALPAYISYGRTHQPVPMLWGLRKCGHTANIHHGIDGN